MEDSWLDLLAGVVICSGLTDASGKGHWCHRMTRGRDKATMSSIETDTQYYLVAQERMQYWSLRLKEHCGGPRCLFSISDDRFKIASPELQ